MNVHPDIQLMLVQQQMRQQQQQAANERALRALEADCSGREASGRVSFFRTLANQLSSLFSAGKPAGGLQLAAC